MNANNELRRILQAIDEAKGDSPNFIEDQDIAKTISMPLQDLRDLLEILGESGYIVLVKNRGGYAARIIAKGRLALKSLLPLETILSSPGTGSEGGSLEAKRSMRTILLLAANPKNTKRIRLDEEQRRIEQALERSRKRDEFKLISKWAVTDDDLRRALLETSPRLFTSLVMATELGSNSRMNLALRFRFTVVPSQCSSISVRVMFDAWF